ncbi:hypothetical protein [Streptomyces sp. SP18CS02]|uniref:hypothetical protein n=1 Tax=Streptomyces sp. SP18CS02 TaxID=3002531 RepID=UPI002E75F336|nr:hypothetical protein [Streptomyces sp. SP18CS02]MEE1751261.1 hypothetical protein [Streptomyces sp. SP18CS02]
MVDHPRVEQPHGHRAVPSSSKEGAALFGTDVLEIHDPDPVLGLSEDALRGRHLALFQARAFAEQVPATAAAASPRRVTSQALICSWAFHWSWAPSQTHMVCVASSRRSH